ncbi:glycoside hydrolase family 66 protein [Paenibacillus arenilitoris]|uniref:Glycoside hydrolase family 66 protein n=1 Tax=Paenibacillus arenilitoris TaxID=2772299 RepID=A0A927H6T9_9BACL|nr:glycoside hydrolase family 66 protein [Paenibacillus arenilitoris]MBD2868909.1 glycoside hydrolase family 66 protein [Paenibacillus arenilitoris]
MQSNRGKIRTASVLLAGCLLAAAAAGCSGDRAIKAETVQRSGAMEKLSTDKAAYKPGEAVKFTLELAKAEPEATIVVQYRHLGETVGRQEIESEGEQVTWDWTAPKEDGLGYMAEVFVTSGGEAKDRLNIAVDVSSDWSKFPRYGYLADFHAMKEEERAAVIERLNRFHLNGIQFYDWQYKHHQPLKLEGGKPAAEWPDIANRPVAFDTVQGYIDLAHDRNMKAMNYNLLFGAYEGAEADGVKREWGLFRDPTLTNQDKHPLPDSWASDIMLYDPMNPEWQAYLIGKEIETFGHLAFDGWHVDQLGDRGSLWNGEGRSAKLSEGYVSFLKAAKEKLDVDYVMNAVGQYGQPFLATQAPLEFLYTEVWESHPKYADLKAIIDQNGKYSKNKLNTVLAAYMNYDLADAAGEFNTPGVLLTDAVIFASGGSHLELGENMLAKEYFPNKNLRIPAELEEQLIRYYDFLVVYQNILRDGLEPSDLAAEGAGELAVSAEPEIGKVWSFAKRKGGSDIVHFLNFADATTLEWRDDEGKQAAPAERSDVAVSFKAGDEVAGIMFASPDYYDGSPVQLDFEQKDGVVTLRLPGLKYWDLLQVTYK